MSPPCRRSHGHEGFCEKEGWEDGEDNEREREHISLYSALTCFGGYGQAADERLVGYNMRRINRDVFAQFVVASQKDASDYKVQETCCENPKANFSLARK